jgi:MHS family proline/betaine transporter-like MFS transporter
MAIEKTQEKLTKEQIRAASLLSIGSTLEYFDLMLYVHMGFILNDLFFPQDGFFSKAQIAVFTLWTSHALRPIGALFFGYIGDLIGRKAAITLSATIMACCCLTIAALPTYKKIGILAPIILTLCRMIQGVSATAEITGAQIYLSETTKPPYQYPLVSSVNTFVAIGSALAIGVGSIFSNTSLFPESWADHVWRGAFLFGATIGVVGALARNSLKEAAEFADRQRSFKEQYKKVGINLNYDNIKVPASLSMAYSFTWLAHPPVFFLIYIYLGTTVLRTNFGLSNLEVTQNNFWVGIVDFIATTMWTLLSYKFHPLKLIRIKTLGFFLSVTTLPIVLYYYPSPRVVLAFQCLLTTFFLSNTPANAIFLNSFPTVKRFRYAGVIMSLVKTGAYFIVPLCIVSATEKLGYKGVLLVFFPIMLLYSIGIRIFEKREKARKTLGNAF